VLHCDVGLAETEVAFQYFKMESKTCGRYWGLVRINSSPKLDKLLITCTATHIQLPGKQSVQET